MRTALHGFEAVTGERSDPADGVAAQIGDLVLFEVSPGGLHGVEFGCIGGIASNREVAILPLQPSTYLWERR